MPLLREGESGQLIQGSATGDVLTWDESDQEWFAEPVSALGITTDDVSNVSSVPAATATGALNNLKTRIDGLTSSLISNVSTVAGATVTAALDTLKGLIAALTTTLVANASTVPGTTATDALNFLLTRGGYGAQAAWAIDPATGNDSNSGSPASPLRTMAEFNSRMFAQAVSVAMTLQLVGDVTDAPLQLASTRFGVATSLTVLGTVTTVGTPSINSVSVLNANTTTQITTTGYVWTSADVGRRILFADATVTWVQEFVDANNVIVGPRANTAGTVTAVTAVGAVTLQTLSTCSAPNVQGTAATTATVVLLRDVTFTPVQAVSNILIQGIPTGFFGCKVNPNGATLLCTTFVNFIGCCLSSGSILYDSHRGSCLGNTHISSNVLWQPGSQTTWNNCSMQASALFVQNQAFVAPGNTHFRNTANPVLVQSGALLAANGVLSGSVGNTGIGVTVKASGGFTWTAGNKPTVTAASGDTKIGSSARTYVQLGTGGYIDTLLNAVPPTQVGLVGSDGTTQGTNAYMLLAA